MNLQSGVTCGGASNRKLIFEGIASAEDCQRMAALDADCGRIVFTMEAESVRSHHLTISSSHRLIISSSHHPITSSSPRLIISSSHPPRPGQVRQRECFCARADRTCDFTAELPKNGYGDGCATPNSGGCAVYEGTCADIPLPVCTPPDTTGYAVVETQLDTVQAFDVTAECAAGYTGTAAVTACDPLSVGTGPYGVTGCTACGLHEESLQGNGNQCTAIVCTPPDTTGYAVVETQLDTVQAFDVTAECAAGYTGTAAVTACVASGPYILAGCAPPARRTVSSSVAFDMDIATISGSRVTARATFVADFESAMAAFLNERAPCPAAAALALGCRPLGAADVVVERIAAGSVVVAFSVVRHCDATHYGAAQRSFHG
jgi:hypothetical protein